MESTYGVSKSLNKALISSSFLAACAATCNVCALSCSACADACLGDENLVNLRRCIRFNLDCADICATTARVMARFFEADPELLCAQLETCVLACVTCGNECRQSASHQVYCRIGNDECQRCESICRELLEQLRAG